MTKVQFNREVAAFSENRPQLSQGNMFCQSLKASGVNQQDFAKALQKAFASLDNREKRCG